MDVPPPARTRTAEEYEQLANAMVAAFDSHDEAALQRLNAHYQRTFTFDDLWAEMWRRVYSFRQRAFKGDAKQSLQPAEAQVVIAQDAGFGSWEALTQAMARRAAGSGVCDRYRGKQNLAAATPDRGEWDELIAVRKTEDRRARCRRVDDGRGAGARPRLDHVTALSSRRLPAAHRRGVAAPGQHAAAAASQPG